MKLPKLYIRFEQPHDDGAHYDPSDDCWYDENGEPWGKRIPLIPTLALVIVPWCALACLLWAAIQILR